MKVTTSKSKNSESFYIAKSFIDNKGKSTSVNVRKLGTLKELLAEHGPTRDDVMEWAKEEARIETLKYKKEQQAKAVQITFHSDQKLDYGQQVFYRGGYLFPKLFTIVSSLIKYAAGSGTNIASNMILMLSFLILSMPESLSRPVNVLLIRQLLNFWKSLLTGCMISTGHLMFWEMNAILSSQRCIRTAACLGSATIRSSITTAQTIFLKLNRKMVIKNMANAKNIVQTPSSRWQCSWTEMVSPLHFHFFPETQMNRLP